MCWFISPSGKNRGGKFARTTEDGSKTIEQMRNVVEQNVSKEHENSGGLAILVFK